MTEPVPLHPLPVFEPLPAPAREPGELAVMRGGTRLALPLEAIDYRASVLDRIADVTVTQRFTNPFDEPLEAVYTFPLSGGAAVRSFELEVAGRTIRAVVRERGEARRAYQQALDEGKRAALLEQERDNVFTIQVGNLPPGERATVRIAYCERLELSDDRRMEIRLPLVVAPRYVPGSSLDRVNAGSGVEDDTDAVPDASRITPPRLAEGVDSGVTVGVEVTLSSPAGGITGLACSQHATSTSFEDGAVSVRLARADERLNRDFVLRWQLAAAEVRASLAVYRHEGHGVFGMLTLVAPPPAGREVARRDVVFLLDHSGSMGGVKMGSASRACELLLESLTPSDRFAIAAFDDRVTWLGDESTPFIAADEAGIARGTTFLKAVDARGGTEFVPALTGAFGAIAKLGDERRLPVVVLVTDGQVGNEHQVLALIQREIGRARLFAVGIDTAVNDALRRMAALGRGTAALVEPGAELEQALRAVAREIGEPEVIDLGIEDVSSGVRAGETAPERLPDLFTGRATTVFLRLERMGAVRVRGRRPDGAAFEQLVEAREVDLPAVGHLWARARVADLEDAYRLSSGSRDDLKRQIVDLSVAHSIVTRFTAMLAVDEAEIANPDGTRRRVVQPVEMPDMWEAEQPVLNYMAAPPLASMPVSYAPLHMALPTQPPAPKSSGSVLGGLFRKLTRAVTPEQPPRPVVDVSKSLEKLVDALRKLAAALRDAVARRRAGALAEAARIEALRSEALDIVRAAGLGKRFPGLELFLETECLNAARRLAADDFREADGAFCDTVTSEIEPVWLDRIEALGDPGTFWEGTV